MSKKQVMDDLDALLADLQSTTSHIGGYQQHPQHQHQQQQPVHHHQQQHQQPVHHHQQQTVHHQQQQTVHHQQQAVHHQQHQFQVPPPPPSPKQAEFNSRESTPPPPLPPPPSQDIIDSLHEDEPIYEMQNVKSASSRPMYSSPHGVTPPPGPGAANNIHRNKPAQQNQPTAMSHPKHASTLSTNLSELDSLLQDLSSAQFMAEVDRRNNAVNVRGEPPPVAEKPGPPMIKPKHGGGQKKQPADQPQYSEVRSVDSLLTELESLTPPPRGQAMPETNHYEIVPPRQAPIVHEMAPTGGVGAASTATRELDDLMASLSEFQVSGNGSGSAPRHVGEPPYAQPSMLPRPTQVSQAAHGDDHRQVMQHDVIESNIQQRQAELSPTAHQGSLEAMLGNLETDMSRQGVTTVPKGHCAACAKPIVGQVITALGRIWHPEHFTCAHCSQELGTQNFFERDGQPYCERDYHTLFSPGCAYCGGPILDKCVTALDKTWHPEHFICAQCGRPFGEDGFHEKEGKPFCRDDYFEMFAPKCGGCQRAIMDNYISALNKQWHPECFICTECHTPFGAGSFFDHEGMPYCETHYHARRGSLCAGCHKPITGRCITAMYKKFHPEHFVCAFCLKQLNKGTFKEQNEKPYCHPCFVKLFG